MQKNILTKSCDINLIAGGKLYIRGEVVEKGDIVFWLYENAKDFTFNIESFYFDELHDDNQGFSHYTTDDNEIFAHTSCMTQNWLLNHIFSSYEDCKNYIKYKKTLKRIDEKIYCWDKLPKDLILKLHDEFTKLGVTI
jgi:hypothetical protein